MSAPPSAHVALAPNLDAIRRVVTIAEIAAGDDPLRAFWIIAHALIYAAGKFHIQSAELESAAALVNDGVAAQRVKEN